MGGAQSSRALCVASALPHAGAFLPARVFVTASRPPSLVRLSRFVRACSTDIPPSPPSAFRLNLLGCTHDELLALLTEWRQPKFRAKQLREWVYERGETDFDVMANLPLSLRAKLAAHVKVGGLQVEQEQLSQDGTVKRLWRLGDGALIESVLMPYDDFRRTACISSQVGCAMGCTFCATGQMGFSRQLTSDEIFEQAARFAIELKSRGERLSNVVFMGMGEPFRNFDAVMDAVRRIRRDLGIGSRHITISTVGLVRCVCCRLTTTPAGPLPFLSPEASPLPTAPLRKVPEIRKFADLCAEESLSLQLAISLHQSSDAARSAIMPVNRKYDLTQLLEACRYYEARCGRRITFEWALIAGENDSTEEAEALGKLLRGIKCHVNLIPLNPTKGYGGTPSGNAQAFVAQLGCNGIPATVRVRRGIDIDAGCGQLAEEASKEAAKRRLEAKAVGRYGA